MCLEHRLLCLEHRLVLQSPCSALNMGIFWQKPRIGTKPPPSIRTPCSKTWTLPFSCRRPPIFPAHPYPILSSFRSPLPMSLTVPVPFILPRHPCPPATRLHLLSPLPQHTLNTPKPPSPRHRSHPAIPSAKPHQTPPSRPSHPCRNRRSWQSVAGASASQKAPSSCPSILRYDPFRMSANGGKKGAWRAWRKRSKRQGR